MARRVTLREISKRVGVSSVAVGAALGLLSAKSRVKVGAQKADEIRRVAHEMGFSPNHLARAFHRQEIKTIGVLFRVLSNPTMVNHMLDEIHRTLDRHGYVASLRPFTGKFERVEATVNDLVAWRVDGLIFVNLFGTDAPEGGWERVSELLERLKVPHVTVESSVECRGAGVSMATDLEAAFEEMTQHLLGLGHRRLATLGNENFLSSRRGEGVRKAVSRVEGACVEGVTIPEKATGNPVHAQVEAIREVTPKLLEIRGAGGAVTAVICGNDIIAAGLMSALKDLGVRVPEDISVTGYDDSEVAVMMRPKLTTMAWPTTEISTAAVEWVLGQVRGEAVEEVKGFHARLVVRGSSGVVKG
jgi:DNA-binding LacI/PurR family transcriptional regulator